MAIQIPPKRRGRRVIPEIRVENPGGGLNTLISDTLIKDKEASDLSNIMFVESGAVAKRTGYSQLGNTLSNNPKGLGVLYTTSVRQLLTIDGTALKYLNNSTWTSIAGITFTAGSETSFVQARDAIYIWNGVDGGAKYDGTTLSRPGTMPSAKFGIFYNGYHFAAGTSTNTSRLYVSTLADAGDFTNDPTAITVATDPDNSTDVPGATVFTGTGTGVGILAQFVDISKGDGDKITALAKFQNQLIVFKERSIYSLTLDSSGIPVVTQVTTSSGAVSHKGVDNVENDVFFPTRNGYYVLGNEPNYYNVVRSNELSQRINPTIKQITESNLSKIASIFSGTVFYSSIPYGGTTTNNRLLTYDRRFLSWAVNTNINANAFTEFVDSNNAKHLYFAADDAAKIYELDTSYGDNGTAISAYWQSKAFAQDKPELYKFWIDVTVIFRQLSGSVTISLIDDEGTTSASAVITSSSDTYGSMGMQQLGKYYMGGAANPSTTTNTATQTNNVPYRIQINKYARTMKIKVENNTLNETFVLLGFVFTLRDQSHYQFPSAQILR